jgi:hypothetical protein
MKHDDKDAAGQEPGPVTAPRETIVTLRGDDRGAAPQDGEASVSLADANRAFFATAEAHGKQAERIIKAVSTTVATELKKKI